MKGHSGQNVEDRRKKKRMRGRSEKKFSHISTKHLHQLIYKTGDEKAS